jgi:hypothetical protein
MKTLDEIHIAPVDSHAAIARAHADRAEYIRLALVKASALIKRLAAKAPAPTGSGCRRPASGPDPTGFIGTSSAARTCLPPRQVRAFFCQP